MFNLLMIEINFLRSTHSNLILYKNKCTLYQLNIKKKKIIVIVIFIWFGINA
jgi:hypothetical protein